MNLAEWMKAQRHTDQSLADEIPGVSRSQISRIRRRKSLPRPETAKLIVEFTGLPVEAVMFTERAA